MEFSARRETHKSKAEVSKSGECLGTIKWSSFLSMSDTFRQLWKEGYTEPGLQKAWFAGIQYLTQSGGRDTEGLIAGDDCDLRRTIRKLCENEGKGDTTKECYIFFKLETTEGGVQSQDSCCEDGDGGHA